MHLLGEGVIEEVQGHRYFDSWVFLVRSISNLLSAQLEEIEVHDQKINTMNQVGAIAHHPVGV